MHSRVPSYVNLHRSGEIRKRVLRAREMLTECTLCPRACGTNRIEGKRGWCGTGISSKVSHFLPHFGEEPPLSGMKGAGTIFFSHCNLSCVYCQNHQISQMGIGEERSSDGLSHMMLELQERGCHNIEFVSPTSHLHAILGALEIAVGGGLIIPLVYNTNGYESLEALALLDGIIDIYLPDFKYADDEIGRRYSSVYDYSLHALSAIKEMQRQVGKLNIEDGVAVRGLIIRHLVLPGHVKNTVSVLSNIAQMLSTNVTLSLMSQYHPLHGAGTHREIGRKITEEEYAQCIDHAEKLGFEDVWIQERESSDELLPDFTANDPFFSSSK